MSLLERVKTRNALTPLPHLPMAPVPFDDADHSAIKAMRDGTATSDQQQRALGWLLFAAGYRGQPWRNDPNDSAFMSGRRHLAVLIYGLLEMPLKNSADDEQGIR